MNTSHDSQPSQRHVGTAPSGPRWPVFLSAVAWLAWLIFLAATVVSRAGGA